MIYIGDIPLPISLYDLQNLSGSLFFLGHPLLSCLIQLHRSFYMNIMVYHADDSDMIYVRYQNQQGVVYMLFFRWSSSVLIYDIIAEYITA